jgi:MurNAc alpha-1-phosphate uridylyltransferase
MILAAGRGERMRPLTDATPKPLLKVAGKTLIERHIEALAAAGCRELVINVCWLGEQIIDSLGDGSRWGVNIEYSIEERALETAGGIVKALPMLGDEFLVVNADIFTDYPFANLLEIELGDKALAHLVMVDNPAEYAGGDFCLSPNGWLQVARESSEQTLTFAGIARYKAAFFAGVESEWLALRPLFEKAMADGLVSGEHYRGTWYDAGAPKRLDALNRLFQTT